MVVTLLGRGYTVGRLTTVSGVSGYLCSNRHRNVTLYSADVDWRRSRFCDLGPTSEMRPCACCPLRVASATFVSTSSWVTSRTKGGASLRCLLVQRRSVPPRWTPQSGHGETHGNSHYGRRAEVYPAGRPNRGIQRHKQDVGRDHTVAGERVGATELVAAADRVSPSPSSFQVTQQFTPARPPTAS